MKTIKELNVGGDEVMRPILQVLIDEVAKGIKSGMLALKDEVEPDALAGLLPIAIVYNLSCLNHLESNLVLKRILEDIESRGFVPDAMGLKPPTYETMQ